MKKSFLTAAVAALAFGANAQQTRYGVELGAHLGNLVQELPELDHVPSGPLRKEHVDGRPNLGIRAGFVADFGISDNFSIQPGLQFVMKGVRYEQSIDTGDNNFGYEREVQSKLNINYFELPINVQYKTREDGTGFFVGAGPYFGYAFGGKQVDQVKTVVYANSNATTTETEVEDELEFGDNANDDIKNLDIGVGLNIGYMMPQGLFVRGYGQYSFSNIYPVPESEFERKNYGFGISIGYLFGGKRGQGANDDPTDAND